MKEEPFSGLDKLFTGEERYDASQKRGDRYDGEPLTWEDIDRCWKAMEKEPQEIALRVTPEAFHELRTVFGIPVYKNELLTVLEEVERSWRERLFSRPWRPWIKTKEVRVPDPTLYSMGGALYGHPETIRRLMTEHFLINGNPFADKEQFKGLDDLVSHE